MAGRGELIRNFRIMMRGMLKFVLEAHCVKAICAVLERQVGQALKNGKHAYRDKLASESSPHGIVV